MEFLKLCLLRFIVGWGRVQGRSGGPHGACSFPTQLLVSSQPYLLPNFTQFFFLTLFVLPTLSSSLSYLNKLPSSHMLITLPRKAPLPNLFTQITTYFSCVSTNIISTQKPSPYSQIRSVLLLHAPVISCTFISWYSSQVYILYFSLIS